MLTSVTANANTFTGTKHRAVRDLTPQLDRAASNSEGSAIILVVERDPHIRELESYFLNEAGFTVDFAADGLDALTRARELRPDIIITEVLVPKLDGLALCRTVKSDPDLHHIVMLVFSILAVQSRAQEAGADAFLMKPLAEKRLVETVRQLLLMRRATGHTRADA
jgi:DNA-binding response OmpR family regulator